LRLFLSEHTPIPRPSIGCQTWPVRESIAKDFPGTIKTLAAAGFQSIELCSPIGYADSGFAGLAKYSAAELKKSSPTTASPVSAPISASTNFARSARQHRLG